MGGMGKRRQGEYFGTNGAFFLASVYLKCLIPLPNEQDYISMGLKVKVNHTVGFLYSLTVFVW